MPNQIMDSLIEAMDMMADGGNKDNIYECVILKCLDTKTGEYELDYLANKITAYALNSSRVYQPGELVFVLAPTGKFNDTKYILGPANPKESEDPTPPEPEDQEEDVVEITDDLLNKDTPKDIFGLKSYEDLDSKDITEGVCIDNYFIEQISNYISGKKASILKFTVDIRTNLTDEQVLSSGDYGIAISIPFVEEGYQEYILDTSKMKGSPKKFLDWAHQTLEIEIDKNKVYNSAYPPVVRIFKKNFVKDEEKVPEDFDIQFKNISLYVVGKLSPEEYNNYYVYLFAEGGTYFLKDEEVDATKKILVSLRKQGEEIDISLDDIYWFKENPEINTDSEFYLDIGGIGWECLNPQEPQPDGSPFNKRLENIIVKAKDIINKQRFKCVIVRDGFLYSNEIVIYKDTRDFDIILESLDGNEISRFATKVELKVKFYYKGITNNIEYAPQVEYRWHKEDVLGKEDANFENYLYILSQGEIIQEEDGKAYYIVNAEFPRDIINQFATIKVDVYINGRIAGFEDFRTSKEHYIGSAEIPLTIIQEEIEGSLPKLLYDYNLQTIVVDQTSTTIAAIACNLLDNIDVEGHLLINFVATEYCDVILRFLDNDVTELFSPVTYSAQPGRNTIGIPHSYIKRLEGLHNFVIMCQCTNGTLTMYTRDVLFTIDAGYLAERLIDAGMDIQDITFKHTTLSQEPEELWAIGIDAGEILLKSRPYKTASNTEWLPVQEFGGGLAAAIEFNGSWRLREKEQTYTLITEEYPFVFIVETDGSLVVYTNNNKETRKVLDTGVSSSISVVRGYKSDEYLNQDQGLVIAYIKDKKPYYMQYVYIETDKRYLWTAAELLTEDEDIESIYVQRLNDYRLGFLLTSKDANWWYITDRTYVNQSVLPENSNNYIDVLHYPVLNMIYSNSSLDFNGHEVKIEEDTTDTFIISFDYPIASRVPLKDLTITMKVNGKETYTVTSEENQQEEFYYFKEAILDGNNLVIKTTKPVTCLKYSDCPVEISVNKYELALKVVKPHLHELTKFTYNFSIPFIPNVLRVEYRDEKFQEIEITTSDLLKVKFAAKIKKENKEETNAIFDTSKLNLSVYPIIKKKHTVKEDSRNIFTVSENFLTVVLVGEKPI